MAMDIYLSIKYSSKKQGSFDLLTPEYRIRFFHIFRQAAHIK